MRMDDEKDRATACGASGLNLKDGATRLWLGQGA